jgi:hypothetical protein
MAEILMGFSDWLDMCPHTVTVEPFVSLDQYGAKTYGAAVTRRARVQGKTRMVRTMTGEESVSHITVYLAPGTIGVQDRITLPSPFTPTQPDILDVQYVSDDAGQHHTVVYA